MTLHRVLDWLILTNLALLVSFSVFALGGYHDEHRVTITILVGVLVMLHGAWLVTLEERPLRLHGTALIWAPFIIYAAINTFTISPVEWLARRDLALWVEAGIVFWICCHNFRTRTAVWLVLITLLLCTIGASLIALYQYFSETTWIPFGFTPSPQYYGRTLGPFAQPNSMAGLIVLTLPLLLMIMLDARRQQVIRVLCGYLAVLLIFALFTTGSRGGFIAAAASILVIPFFLNFGKRARLYLFGCIAVVMVVGCSVLYFNASHFQSRIDKLMADGGENSRKAMYEVAYAVAADNPLFGAGGGSFELMFEKLGSGETQRRATHTHNEYLNFLSDYGMVGLFLFFFPVILILVRAYRSWERMPFEAYDEHAHTVSSPDAKIIAAGLIIGMFAFLLHCGVDYHLHVPALLFIFAICLGFLVRASSKRGMPIPMPAFSMPVFYLAAGIFIFTFLPRTLTSSQAAAYRAEARATLDELVEPDARYGKERMKEKLEKAEHLLQRARRLDSQNADVFGDYSQVMLMKAHLTTDPEKRKRLLDEADFNAQAALELCDQAWVYYIYKAWALYQKDQPLGKLVPTLDMAVLMGVNRANAWYYRARILSNYPEAEEEAEEAIRRARELSPGNPNFKNYKGQ